MNLKLREYRERSGLTQKQFAREIKKAELEITSNKVDKEMPTGLLLKRRLTSSTSTAV